MILRNALSADQNILLWILCVPINLTTAPTAAQRWMVMGMAKCKECLHYEACSAFSKIINVAVDVEKGCEHFSPKLVRCKDCKHRGSNLCPMETVELYPWFGTKNDAFCSYGERKEGE